MAQPQIQVLLSTYNGEKYIKEQLDSVLAQQGVSLNLLIRDDGSIDSTCSIIENYVEKNQGRILFSQGANSGAKGSFFKLIEQSSDGMDYYAFCDQDDIWEPGKLQRAVSLLKQEDNDLPLMYCSATRMVDNTLSYLGTWPSVPRKSLTLYNALVENIAVGCTMVMNRAAMELVKKHLPRDYANVIMHDWWVYLIVSAFGKVNFDDTPHLLYRQHGGNVLGGQTDGVLAKWRKRLKRFSQGQNHYILSNQARLFYSTFEPHLSDEHKKSILQFMNTLEQNAAHRMIYAIHSPFYRQSALDNLVLKVIYAARKV
ncbi:glycosyltransferase family 2 protein [Paenibacillus caui]|uniref:glycosyltransferase family 2 protein n=1 Tax=Paenibacillus caui TaxID=2873927 RepID=UPI001CA86E77|nr:glycosyltransferase family 2 protein [Paenibacillus caui]